ncbi:MAG: hypothetical protein AAF310_04635 [Myxococcota bacterium]
MTPTKLTPICHTAAVALALLLAGCSGNLCGDYTQNGCNGKTDKDNRTCMWNGIACIPTTTVAQSDMPKIDPQPSHTDAAAIPCEEITNQKLCVGACKYNKSTCVADPAGQVEPCISKQNTLQQCLEKFDLHQCAWSRGGCWRHAPKYCVNKADLDWPSLKGMAATQEDCEALKFGPNQTQPFEWDATGKCALQDTICALGVDQKLAMNGNYATNTLFYSRVLGAAGDVQNSFKITRYGSGGKQQAPCGTNGNIVGGITGNNDPCHDNKTHAQCTDQAVIVDFDGAGLLLRDGNNTITLKHHCQFEGRDHGCYLKNTIPDFGCTKASLTDCSGQYKDVCTVLDTSKVAPSL